MFSVFRYLLCSSFLYNGGWYMPRLFLQLSSHQSLYFSLSYKKLMSAALMNIGTCCISQLKYEHLAEHLINSLSLRHSKCQWKTKFVHYRLLFINTTLLSCVCAIRLIWRRCHLASCPRSRLKVPIKFLLSFNRLAIALLKSHLVCFVTLFTQ